MNGKKCEWCGGNIAGLGNHLHICETCRRNSISALTAYRKRWAGREEFKMTNDYDAKRFTAGLVRVANKYGYRMKQFISSTHRVMVNDAEETLEIELLEG